MESAKLQTLPALLKKKKMSLIYPLNVMILMYSSTIFPFMIKWHLNLEDY